MDLQEDAVWGNVNCYKIESQAATYYFDTEGAGLSGLVDKDGRDWIGFDSKTEGPSGNYRGMPNAVHKQCYVSCFHPLNQYTSLAEITITSQVEDAIALSAQCSGWEAAWQFSENSCRFDMTVVPAGCKYWVLYEGAPYGDSTPDKSWFYLSDSNKKLTCGEENFAKPLPDPQWIAFGHNDSPRVLLLVNHDLAGKTGRYYWMKTMTVFGFGRGEKVHEKYFDSPGRFTIMFVESTDWDEIRKVAAELL